MLLAGKQLHTHTIQSLRNVTGAIQPFNNSVSIYLRQDKATGFRGLADIATNGKITWKSVPVEMHLINDNIINIHINAAKTNNHFNDLPIWHIVINNWCK